MYHLVIKFGCKRVSSLDESCFDNMIFHCDLDHNKKKQLLWLITMYHHTIINSGYKGWAAQKITVQTKLGHNTTLPTWLCCTGYITILQVTYLFPVCTLTKACSPRVKPGLKLTNCYWKNNNLDCLKHIYISVFSDDFCPKQVEVHTSTKYAGSH